LTATAFEEGHRVLYHWQRFDEECLAKTLKELVDYFSGSAATVLPELVHEIFGLCAS
jgi:hypothetical protein